MSKTVESLINSSMLSCIEGYAALVVGSIEFELGRELSSEEYMQVYTTVEHSINTNDKDGHND